MQEENEVVESKVVESKVVEKQNKPKIEKVKYLYIVFWLVLFFELVGSLGSALYGNSDIIKDAGVTNTFLVIITAIAIAIPWIIERHYDIDIPDYLEIVLLVMLFIAIVLGFLNDYYVTVSGFDKLTHTLSGVTLSIIAFQTLYVFNNAKGIAFKLEPFVMSIFSYTLSITLLVIWEFYEFTADTIGYNFSKDSFRNMQRYQWVNESTIFPQDYGLYDTMIDLLVGAGGAFVVVVIGYLIISKKTKKPVTQQ